MYAVVYLQAQSKLILSQSLQNISSCISIVNPYSLLTALEESTGPLYFGFVYFVLS